MADGRVLIDDDIDSRPLIWFISFLALCSSSLRTFSNISVYHKFAWLRETVTFIRERECELTQFDDPTEIAELDTAAVMNEKMGVGNSADNQIEIDE